MTKKKAEFTEIETRLINSIAELYAKHDKRKELVEEIKSFIRYDRILMKERITNALKNLL